MPLKASPLVANMSTRKPWHPLFFLSVETLKCLSCFLYLHIIYIFSYLNIGVFDRHLVLSISSFNIDWGVAFSLPLFIPTLNVLILFHWPTFMVIHWTLLKLYYLTLSYKDSNWHQWFQRTIATHLSLMFLNDYCNTCKEKTCHKLFSDGIVWMYHYMMCGLTYLNFKLYDWMMQCLHLLLVIIHYY